MTDTRGDMLANLADAVNELTEIRHHVEKYEAEERDGAKRRRVRRNHVQEFPSLLDELLDAMQPASSGDAGAAGFESRPAAELEPIAVLTCIETECAVYGRALAVKDRTTLAGKLRELVSAASARATDTQLGNLAHDAAGWVRKARLATGWEQRAFMLNSACPYCFSRNSLTVTGDLERARCTKCRSEWDDTTVGLLGQMLAVNETAETWTTARCDSIHGGHGCQRLDGHNYEHRDSTGRYWYSTPDGTTYVDTAKSSDPSGRMTA